MSHAAASMMVARIERTLTHEQQDGGQTVIRQDGILSFREPVVILGDPGLGKTVLTQWLGEQPGTKFVRAGTFVRAANPSNSVAGTERIVVDGLDEFASAAPGGALTPVLKAALGDRQSARSSFLPRRRLAGRGGQGEDRGRLRRGARAAPSAAVHGRRRARFPLRGSSRRSIPPRCWRIWRAAGSNPCTKILLRYECSARWRRTTDPSPRHVLNYSIARAASCSRRPTRDTIVIPMLAEAKKNCCWQPAPYARHSCCAAATEYSTVRTWRRRRDT